MKYSELARVYEKLDSTTKRLDKTEHLSQFLKHVQLDQIEEVVLLLQELPLGADLNVFETRTVGDNLRAKDEPRPVEAALHVNGPWWDPRRAPQSVVDWLVIGTAGALVAGVVVGILWRLG